ncbi:MAG: porin [Nannocystales bacterium]
MFWLVIALLCVQPATRGTPEVRAVPYPVPAPTPVAATQTATDPPPDVPTETAEVLTASLESQLPPTSPSSTITVGAPGDGLRWLSADGRFSLRLGLRGQVRYDVVAAPDASPSQSLSLRRARVKFSGHTFGQHNTYKLELGVSPRDMGMAPGGPRFTPVLDWALEFSKLRDLQFRVGQYKLPYSRARMQSSGDLQFVDRSIADGEFNLNRDVGFDLHSDDLFGLDHLGYYAGMFLGEGRDAYQPTNFEVVYLARLEVFPFGTYEADDTESDHSRERVPRMSLGFAYAFVDGAQFERGTIGARPEDGGTTDVHNGTVDASFKFGGATVFAEGYVREGRRRGGPSIPAAGLSPARNGYGWNAQAGYLWGPKPFELVGRFAETRPTADSPLPRQRQPSVVLGYYFFGHAVKLQLDYSPTWSESLTDVPSHVIRLQFQGAL